MLALVFSDIHGNLEYLKIALKRHPTADSIFIAGDITNFGNAIVVETVFNLLLQGSSSRQIAAVAGNCDTQSARATIRSSGYDVEGMLKEFSWCRVGGVGGGLRRAGITSFERTEEELADSLKPCQPSKNASFPDQKGSFTENKPLVIVTHTPPYGTNADIHQDHHVGSISFARFMANVCPDVWICGHIHESRCVSREDETLVINPGPCALGFYAILHCSGPIINKNSLGATLARV